MLKSRHHRQILSATLWLLSALGSLRVGAHEFWIEPIRFELSAGDVLRAYVRVGQEMKGDSLPFIPQAYVTINLTNGGTTRPITSRTGDDPAVNEPLRDNGLTVISCVSTGNQLTYSEPGKFERFLKNEGIGWVMDAHAKRSLPAQGFTESYQRFAKSLIRVGDGKGRDSALGLEFELVVETNPYTNHDSDVVAQLLWQGKPFQQARINVFRRYDGKVSRTHAITDTEGRVHIPRLDAPGVYLLNAVHMIEPPPSEQGVVWKSLWASTTFEVLN